MKMVEGEILMEIVCKKMVCKKMFFFLVKMVFDEIFLMNSDNFIPILMKLYQTETKDFHPLFRLWDSFFDHLSTPQLRAIFVWLQLSATAGLHPSAFHNFVFPWWILIVSVALPTTKICPVPSGRTHDMLSSFFN